MTEAQKRHARKSLIPTVLTVDVDVREVQAVPWFGSCNTEEVPTRVYVGMWETEKSGGYISYDHAYAPMQTLLYAKGIEELEFGELTDHGNFYRWEFPNLIGINDDTKDAERVRIKHADGCIENAWKWSCGWTVVKR